MKITMINGTVLEAKTIEVKWSSGCSWVEIECKDGKSHSTSINCVRKIEET